MTMMGYEAVYVTVREFAMCADLIQLPPAIADACARNNKPTADATVHRSMIVVLVNNVISYSITVDVCLPSDPSYMAGTFSLVSYDVNITHLPHGYDPSRLFAVMWECMSSRGYTTMYISGNAIGFATGLCTSLMIRDIIRMTYVVVW